MFTKQSSMFGMNFLQIAEIDWLPGLHKWKCFLNIFKKLLVSSTYTLMEITGNQHPAPEVGFWLFAFPLLLILQLGTSI